jgi:Skp family chaperone for outer membrane proteins
MSDSPTVRWEDMLEEHNVNPSELPEKIQHKIGNYDKIYAEYDQAEEGSKEFNDFENQLEALDNGIVIDLQTFIAEKKAKEDEEASKANPAMANGGQTDTNSQSTNQATSQETPSWRFWM